MCSDVITMRQNPSKLEAVGRICCEVLLDIKKLLEIFDNRIGQHFCIATEMMVSGKMKELVIFQSNLFSGKIFILKIADN